MFPKAYRFLGKLFVVALVLLSLPMVVMAQAGAGAYTFSGIWQGQRVNLIPIPNITVESLPDTSLVGQISNFETNEPAGINPPYYKLDGESLNVWTAPTEFPGLYVVHNGDQGTQAAYGTWTFPMAAPTEPILLSMSPTSAPPGTTVTFVGSGLGQAAGSVVFTNQTSNVATEATVTSWSPTQVVCSLPADLAPGMYIPSLKTADGQPVGPGSLASWPLLQVLAPTTPPTATPGASGSQKVTVNIPATAGWFNTGIALTAGEEVTIIASGTINDGSAYAQNATSGPAGLGEVSSDGYSCTSNVHNPQPNPYLVAAVPCESLVGFIGKTPPRAPANTAQNVFEVGSSDSFTAPNSGELFLAVNDNYFPDNSGSFQATIAVGPPPTVPPSAPPVFSDLSGYTWAAGAISSLAKASVIRGVAPRQFDPAGTVTRAQLAELLHRTYHLPPLVSLSFRDVGPGDWEYRAAQAMAPFLSLSPLSSASLFKPNAPVSRERTVVAIVRLLNSEGRLTILPSGQAASILAGFSDADSVAVAERVYVATAISAGLFKGVGTNLLSPRSTLNRAQIAVLLDRLVKRFPPGAANSSSSASSATSPQVLVFGPGGNRSFTIWQLPDQISGQNCFDGLCNATAAASTQPDAQGTLTQLQLLGSAVGMPEIRSDTWFEAPFNNTSDSDDYVKADLFVLYQQNGFTLGVANAAATGTQLEFNIQTANGTDITQLESPHWSMSITPPPLLPTDEASTAEDAEEIEQPLADFVDNLSSTDPSLDNEIQQFYEQAKQAKEAYGLAEDIKKALEGVALATGQSETGPWTLSEFAWTGNVGPGSSSFNVDIGTFSALAGAASTTVHSVRAVVFAVTQSVKPTLTVLTQAIKDPSYSVIPPVAQGMGEAEPDGPIHTGDEVNLIAWLNPLPEVCGPYNTPTTPPANEGGYGTVTFTVKGPDGYSWSNQTNPNVWDAQNGTGDNAFVQAGVSYGGVADLLDTSGTNMYWSVPNIPGDYEITATWTPPSGGCTQPAYNNGSESASMFVPVLPLPTDVQLSISPVQGGGGGGGHIHPESAAGTVQLSGGEELSLQASVNLSVTANSSQATLYPISSGSIDFLLLKPDGTVDDLGSVSVTNNQAAMSWTVPENPLPGPYQIVANYSPDPNATPLLGASSGSASYQVNGPPILSVTTSSTSSGAVGITETLEPPLAGSDASLSATVFNAGENSVGENSVSSPVNGTTTWNWSLPTSSTSIYSPLPPYYLDVTYTPPSGSPYQSADTGNLELTSTSLTLKGIAIAQANLTLTAEVGVLGDTAASPPLGKVTFYANGENIGTASVTTDGTASIAWSPPASGAYTLSAVFSGSGFAASTATLSVNVAPSPGSNPPHGCGTGSARCD